MVVTANLGSPRTGADRELKRALRRQARSRRLPRHGSRQPGPTELRTDRAFTYASDKAVAELGETAALGIATRPVLFGAGGRCRRPGLAQAGVASSSRPQRGKCLLGAVGKLLEGVPCGQTRQEP